MTIHLSEQETVHIAELLKSDVIARQVLFNSGGGHQDESSILSKKILIKFTLAAMGIYDEKITTSKPVLFPGNPRLN